MDLIFCIDPDPLNSYTLFFSCPSLSETSCTFGCSADGLSVSIEAKKEKKKLGLMIVSLCIRVGIISHRGTKARFLFLKFIRVRWPHGPAVFIGRPDYQPVKEKKGKGNSEGSHRPERNGSTQVYQKTIFFKIAHTK